MMQLNKKIEKVFLVIEDFTDRIFHYGRISQCSNNNHTNNYMIKYNTYYKIYIRIWFNFFIYDTYKHFDFSKFKQIANFKLFIDVPKFIISI